ncbi:MAG: HIT family protein [Flavobacterium sp.]|nr:HIT family protein [Flavobacterium sp.]
MPTVFSKIVSGEIPCYKIAEDDNFLAFLDVNPNAVGHTLCIPKQEINKFFDLSDHSYTALLLFAKRVALALEKTIPCKRIGMSVIGLEVPHAHIHLIPLNEMNEMRFENKISMTPDAFEDLALAIRMNVNPT